MHSFFLQFSLTASAMPLLETNLRRNSHLISSSSNLTSSTSSSISPPVPSETQEIAIPSTQTPIPISIKPIPLDWEQPPPSEIGTFSDLVLISDCTYNSDFFIPLIESTIKLLSNNIKTESDAIDTIKADKPLVLLSKKHRHEDEESFWKESEKRGLKWKLITGRNGWGDKIEGGKTVYEGWGIWIGWLEG